MAKSNKKKEERKRVRRKRSQQKQQQKNFNLGFFFFFFFCKGINAVSNSKSINANNTQAEETKLYFRCSTEFAKFSVLKQRKKQQKKTSRREEVE